jgi:hypothetical protein
MKSKKNARSSCLVRGCNVPAAVPQGLCLGCFHFLTRGDLTEPFAKNSRAYELVLLTAETILAGKIHDVLFEV